MLTYPRLYKLVSPSGNPRSADVSGVVRDCIQYLAKIQDKQGNGLSSIDMSQQIFYSVESLHF